MIFCPDCERDIPRDEFVQHREREHPAGETKVVAVHEPLHSGERMGWEE
jgi:hypothetical protein